MQLNTEQTQTLAAMLCDYAEIEGICITPEELSLIISIVVNAKFPQPTIEALWRVHVQAVETLNT